MLRAIHHVLTGAPCPVKFLC